MLGSVGQSETNNFFLAQTTVENDYFTEWGERRGEGMTAIKTPMNIYPNYLQTNTKTGKLFKKGF